MYAKIFSWVAASFVAGGAHLLTAAGKLCPHMADRKMHQAPAYTAAMLKCQRIKYHIQTARMMT